MRAYPSISLRQQRKDRLVYSEGDLRRALSLGAAGNSATIRLGGDIVVTSPIELDGTYSVQIDGGSRYSIVLGDGLDYLFTVPEQVYGVSLSSITVSRGSSTSSGSCLFNMDGGGISLFCFDAVTTENIRRIASGSGDVSGGSIRSLVMLGSDSPNSFSLFNGLTIERIVTLGTTKASGVAVSVGTGNTIGNGCVFIGASRGDAGTVVDQFGIIADDNGDTMEASTDRLAWEKASGPAADILHREVSTSGASSATLFSAAPETGRSAVVEAIIIARRTNGSGQSTAYKIASLLVENSGLTVTNIAGASWSGNDVNGWSVTVDAFGDIVVTGAVGHNVSWSAQIRVASL